MFEGGLGQSFPVAVVLAVGAMQYFLAVLLDDLLVNDGTVPAPALSSEIKFVTPLLVGFTVQHDAEAHASVVEVSGCKASHPIHATAKLDGVLQPSAGSGDVTQESQRIQEVRFTGGVGADDERRSPMLASACLKLRQFFKETWLMRIGRCFFRKSRFEQF